MIQKNRAKELSETTANNWGKFETLAVIRAQSLATSYQKADSQDSLIALNAD